MLDKKAILAVVPARGGSKQVPLKNLHPLRGRPLIAYAGDVVSELDDLVDRAVVSTDHEGIAEEAERSGLAAPFRRPAELSRDRVGDHEVLVHALQQMEAMDGREYGVVVMLQPTSPLRRAHHVESCIRKLVEQSLDAVWTVSPTALKYHPLKQLTISEAGELKYFDRRGSRVVSRQQLDPVYHRNGAAYAFTRGCLLDQGTILGRRSGAIVIDEPMISIDTHDDFLRVAELLASR